MSLALLETLLSARDPIALCTVMQVKGSAPRHPGSWMLAGPGGLVAGSVGGGRGESMVLAVVREALADGKPRVLEVEMQGNEAEGMDMVCGGTSRVLVQEVHHEVNACLHFLGNRGGYVAGPAKAIMADVPDANAVALVDALVNQSVAPGREEKRFLPESCEALWRVYEVYHPGYHFSGVCVEGEIL